MTRSTLSSVWSNRARPRLLARLAADGADRGGLHGAEVPTCTGDLFRPLDGLARQLGSEFARAWSRRSCHGRALSRAKVAAASSKKGGTCLGFACPINHSACSSWLTARSKTAPRPRRPSSAATKLASTLSFLPRRPARRAESRALWALSHGVTSPGLAALTMSRSWSQWSRSPEGKRGLHGGDQELFEGRVSEP
jgi:hypothetical protein